jgi:hypothetical protein
MNIYHVQFETDEAAFVEAKRLSEAGVACHVSRAYNVSPAYLVIELPTDKKPEDYAIENAVLAQAAPETPKKGK